MKRTAGRFDVFVHRAQQSTSAHLSDIPEVQLCPAHIHQKLCPRHGPLIVLFSPAISINADGTFSTRNYPHPASNVKNSGPLEPAAGESRSGSTKSSGAQDSLCDARTARLQGKVPFFGCSVNQDREPQYATERRPIPDLSQASSFVPLGQLNAMAGRLWCSGVEQSVRKRNNPISFRPTTFIRRPSYGQLNAALFGFIRTGKAKAKLGFYTRTPAAHQQIVIILRTGRSGKPELHRFVQQRYSRLRQLRDTYFKNRPPY